MRKEASKKLRLAAMFAAFALIITLVSCNKNKKEETVIITPVVPENVLPAEVKTEIKKYMDIYEGENPPQLNGQFVSRPHALFHESYNPSYNPEDSTVFYYDRYVAFVYSENGIDFYGKQLDSVKPNGDSLYYEEHISKLKITGTGKNFSCYYDTEGYPNGLYAKYSTIFSGNWDEKTGIIDFKVAVVMVETSGNPNLEPKNSFRVLGDYDGLAEINNWMGKKSSGQTTNDPNCVFRMFKKKK